MSISAHIQTDVNGDIVVEFNGALEYETGQMLREQLQTLVKEYPAAKITLDFCHVEFVGSSGIGKFVETYNLITSKTDQLSLRHVKPEFIKVFKLYHLSGIEEIERQTEEEESQFADFRKIKKSLARRF